MLLLLAVLSAGGWGCGVCLQVLCCRHCFQMFKSRSSLNRHEQRHLGIYEYTCELCGKGCSSRHMYDSHMANVHNRPLIHCPKCNKKLPSSVTVEGHLSKCMAATNWALCCCRCHGCSVRCVRDVTRTAERSMLTWAQPTACCTTNPTAQFASKPSPEMMSWLNTFAWNTALRLRVQQHLDGLYIDMGREQKATSDMFSCERLEAFCYFRPVTYFFLHRVGLYRFMPIAWKKKLFIRMRVGTH